jgi:hypothetical protein
MGMACPQNLQILKEKKSIIINKRIEPNKFDVE